MNYHELLKIHNKVKNSLNCYHRVFNVLMNYSMVQFKSDYPTAWMEFDAKQGNPISFCFNPQFFQQLSFEQLQFVYVHEMSHILQNYGLRLKDRIPNIFNIAADLVINEYNFSNLGFNRDEIIKDALADCIHTYDKHFDSSVKKAQNVEYYYGLLKDKNSEEDSFDFHNFLEIPGNFINKVLKQIPSAELPALKKILEKGIVKRSEKGQFLKQIDKFIDAPKVSLENVFKHSVPYKSDKYEYEWVRDNYNYGSIIHQSLKLPYERIKELQDKEKTSLFVYIDTSDSCVDYVERFFKLSDALDLDKYKVRLFGFHTEVYEIIDRKIYTGGTYFHIIEEHLKTQPVYPDAVMLITDGNGTYCIAEYPERWTVFLTVNNTSCFPQQAKMNFITNF